MNNYYNTNEDDIPIAIPVPLAPPENDPTIPQRRPSLKPHQHPSFHIPPSQRNLTSHQTPTPIPPPILSTLLSQGYTHGLSQLLYESTTLTFPLRFWVVDNSGSMAMTDGHRLVGTKTSKVKIVSCTRWKELQETIEYHAQMAALLSAPTVFHLLNDPGVRVGPQELSIGQEGPEQIDVELARIQQTITNASPTGVTPLSRHVRDIRQQVSMLAPQLQQEGRKVTIVLATDGLPTNEMGIGGEGANREFVNSLQSLEGLPIWLVIRLCTDEDKIVEFYNSLDSQLELSIEVLDDFVQEAEEVHQFNPWLNYTLCIHRMREMGVHNRLFDFLDERALTLGEVGEFCTLVLGREAMDGVPDPEEDLGGFLAKVQTVLAKEKGQWNPVKKKIMPYLNLEKIQSIYGEGSCSIM